jgi:hypothetical protein
LIGSFRTPLLRLCIRIYKKAATAASPPKRPAPNPDFLCCIALFVCVAAAAFEEVCEALLTVLVGEVGVTLLDDAFAVAAVAVEPLELEVAVEVQETAVGRLVTAFALQRLRAYCVAAC